MNTTDIPQLFLPIEMKKNILNPDLSDKQMEVHYVGHYLKYVSNFNKFLNTDPRLLNIYNQVNQTVQPEFFRKYLLLTIIQFYDTSNTIYQNVAQIYNHELFFNSLTSEEISSKYLNEYKNKLFSQPNSFDLFYQKFMDLGSKFFGSGWLWIIKQDNNTLDLVTTPDAIVPINLDICACIDLWEHAYYIDYESERKKYLTNVFKLINWKLIYEKINLIN
jgi:Fe-Mn family superoxide dismutase